MINVVNVTHHYGVKPVLKSISMTVERGELVALMGPNGMGKSTLMAVIAGMLWPVKGHVEIDGKRRRASEEIELAIRQSVVYLTADPWIPLNRTGRSWMLSTGRLWGVDDGHLMPISIMTMGIILPWGLDTAGVNTPLAAGLSVFILVAATLNLGPTLRRWQLTGHHRIVARQRRARATAAHSSL